MWTRKEVKTSAKEFLKKNYWKAFLVCLIFAILTDTGGSNTNVVDNQIEIQESYEDFLPDGYIGDTVDRAVTSGTSSFFGISNLPSFFLGMTGLALILGFLISVFFTNVLEVGLSKFFLDGFKGYTRVGNMFSIFKQNNYMNMVITQVKRQVFIGLWTLLFIIPGIIKTFQYIMIPYILADEPDLSSSEVFARSKELTDGNKFDIFVLGLSFLGWYILGLLAFGVGVIFVTPYVKASYAQLYLKLKKEKGFGETIEVDAVNILDEF